VGAVLAALAAADAHFNTALFNIYRPPIHMTIGHYAGSTTVGEAALKSKIAEFQHLLPLSDLTVVAVEFETDGYI